MWRLLLFVLPNILCAETVVSTRVIRVGTVIGMHDLQPVATMTSGAFQSVEEVVGLEARVILYPGRPILYDHVGEPAIILRNQVVSLSFQKGGLRISTEGRSLARGGVGDVVPVINLASRTTVRGVIQSDGAVLVGSSGD